MKKLILIFLSLIVCVSLASCGECEHADANNDGICDECEWNYDHEHAYSTVWNFDQTHHWNDVMCGHSIPVKDMAPHSDSNSDGICDVCTWDYDHTHTYSEAWSHDGTNHWHASSCGHTGISVKDKAAHSDSNSDGICDVCTWDYDHTHTYASEWSRDGDYHWYAITCEHTGISVKDKAPHSDDNNDGLCDGCAWNYEHTHTFESEWTYDSENHWHAASCLHEIEVSGKAPHVDSDGDGVCDVCSEGSEPEVPGDIELPEIDFD